MVRARPGTRPIRHSFDGGICGIFATTPTQNVLRFIVCHALCKVPVCAISLSSFRRTEHSFRSCMNGEREGCREGERQQARYHVRLCMSSLGTHMCLDGVKLCGVSKCAECSDRSTYLKAQMHFSGSSTVHITNGLTLSIALMFFNARLWLCMNSRGQVKCVGSIMRKPNEIQGCHSRKMQ